MTRYGNDGPCTLAEAQDDDDERVNYRPPASACPCLVVGTIHGVEIHELDDTQDGAR